MNAVRCFCRQWLASSPGSIHEHISFVLISDVIRRQSQKIFFIIPVVFICEV